MTDQNPLYDADRHARILTLARNLDLDLDPDLDFDLDFDLLFILTLDLGLDLTRDFARALNLGLDLTRVAARVVARDRARTLDRALALARARAFARDLARDRTVARDLARILAYELARALGRTRDFARALAHDLARALAHDLDHDLDRLRALGRARDFARALGCDRALARTLSRALAHDLDRDCARALAHDLDLDRLRQALYRINAFIDQGEQLDASAKAKAKAKAEPAPVARSAERLVDVVMRLLPAQHRIRYAEEFKAELYDLAQAKATTTVQVVYALQQLSRVWRLREALLTPDRPRFHRLHRAARWVLATETRTWTPLTGLLLWGGAETALDTGPGTAILLVAGSGAVLQAGVTWGRNRLGVEVQQRKSTE